jgi:hypothetical protein
MPHSSDQESASGKARAADRKSKSNSRTKRNPTPRQELPDLDSLLDLASEADVVYFTTPKGNTYAMIETDQMDSYDKPESPPKPKRVRKKRHKS